MKSKTTNTNQGIKPWMIVTGIATLGTAGGAYWYFSRKKRTSIGANTQINNSSNLLKPTANKKTPIYSKRKGLKARNSLPYIKYGSRHPDVKVLQRYLKFIKKADIGRSGRKRDGIDGIYGPKTLKATKKYLKKTSFSRVDMNGLRASLKKIGK